MFHLLANLWCLLAIQYAWKIRWKEYLTAYIVTVCYGIIIYSYPNTYSVIGLSSLTYALAGLRSISGNRKRDITYITTILITNMIMSVIPSFSFLTHFACYMIALSVSAARFKRYKYEDF